MSENRKMVNVNLHTDIISEILLRLPAKSLLRFKYVCKTWRDLIENPNFIEKHEKIRSGITCILVSTDDEIYLEDEGVYKFVDFNTLILNARARFRILGICNGLVCAKFSKVDYVIGNPTTREFRLISSPRLLVTKGTDLVFHGFVLFSNEYMVVRLIYRNISTLGEVVVEAEVYIMSISTWLELDVKKGHHVNDVGRLIGYKGGIKTVHVLLNGVFYWEAITSDGGRILTFDLSDGIVDEISIPISVINVKEYSWRIIEFEEKISLVLFTGDRKFELWALNGNGDSWTWRLRFDTIRFFPEKPAGFISVWDYKRNGELLVMETYWDDDKVYLYDMNSRETKNLPCFDIEDAFYCFCTESLRSVSWIH